MFQRITKRDEDYSRWYTDLILNAKLADYSPVKGCMVIRPNGYAIWEKMSEVLDSMFKETGHVNAYFPLFIPESFIAKEKEHLEGFSPELAIVTHGGGKKLEENFVVRPTSETIIWSMYKKWIMSYRDLPVLINQWANVVRWEMRTRLFLRTTEFLWQEGHTAHATAEEARTETLKMLEVYRKFAEDYMALPVIKGMKTELDKFPGARETFCIEAMMQDKKSLQAGTSHDLGQNFAKAFDVTFQTKEGGREYVWATSWGVSTRLVGALIMAHSDDSGLVLPPRLAKNKAVVVPIWYNDDDRKNVLEFIEKNIKTAPEELGIIIDDREGYTSGWKFNEWELAGIPVRIEVGPRDIKKNQVVVVRRDNKTKEFISLDNLFPAIKKILDSIQEDLFNKALKFRDNNTFTVDVYDEFTGRIEDSGGYYRLHWCRSAGCAEEFKAKSKASIICIPLTEQSEEGKCIVCSNPSPGRVMVAKTY